MSKITKEELTTINELNLKLKQTQSELGRLELVKADTLDAFKQTMLQFNDVKAELTKNYGNITINLEDGTYEVAQEEEEQEAEQVAEMSAYEKSTK